MGVIQGHSSLLSIYTIHTMCNFTLADLLHQTNQPTNPTVWSDLVPGEGWPGWCYFSVWLSRKQFPLMCRYFRPARTGMWLSVPWSLSRPLKMLESLLAAERPTCWLERAVWKMAGSSLLRVRKIVKTWPDMRGKYRETKTDLMPEYLAMLMQRSFSFELVRFLHSSWRRKLNYFAPTQAVLTKSSKAVLVSVGEDVRSINWPHCRCSPGHSQSGVLTQRFQHQGGRWRLLWM